MKVAYISRTGNVQSFMNKTHLTNVFEIIRGDEVLHERFVLITYTDGYGELPSEVEDFLSRNASNMVAAAVSGDTSYGEAYCGAAEVLSQNYGIPILLEFEFDGTEKDVETFLSKLAELN